MVIGGGIVGLATALAWVERRPDLSIALVEKEARVGAHQTGRNSGVLHSGVYYRPGSLKARLCVEGERLLRAFCAAHGVACVPRGKVIVAASEAERPRLLDLLERGRANGVAGVRLLTPEALREIEPHARGAAALHVPGVAVTEFARVAEACAALVTRSGGVVRTGARVVALRRDGGATVVGTTAGEFRARVVVNCAGLWSDRVALLDGADPGLRIVPFRGEYWSLRRDRRHLARGLVYPVPDARFPFLGVHLTRRADDSVEAGPNAVLAWAREGYRRRDVDPREMLRLAMFPGFRALARRHARAGLAEQWRSLSKGAFVRALRRLVPEIGRADLVPGGSGVRAQAVTPDGSLLDDFRFVRAPGRVHVLNVPSPAATASLAIGRHIAALVEEVA